MRTSRLGLIAGIALVSVPLVAGTSFACADHEYEQCVLGACVCLPKIGGAVGQGAQHLKEELQGQIGGPVYEQAIVQSRNTAINGAMPIPPQIRQALTGYASADSMNRARYKIQDNGALNLARLTFQLNMGHPTAITLIDVIVFRGPTEANDPALWAHELVHVDQYASWGVRDFAISYARNSGSVEAPAYERGNSYWAWAQNNGIGQVGSAPGPTPQGVGAFCYTPFGRFGPGPTQPVGTLCVVMSPQGQMQGQIGF